MKKIVLFEDVFGDFGGIEKVIITIISNLYTKYEFELVVNSMISNEYLVELNKYNVKVKILQDTYIRNPIKRHLIGLKKFKKYLKSNPLIDVIHFNISNSIDLIYVAIAKKFKIKKRIAHSHNSSATSKFKIIMHNLIKPFVMYSPTDYLACSKEAAIWLFPKKIVLNKKYVFVPNSVDYNLFSYKENYRNEIRNKFNISDDEFLYGHIGRFNAQKNQIFLIDIFNKILKINSKSKLMLVGVGETKAEIINKCKEYNIENNVLFIEPTKEINKFYSAFDIFLFPSLYEGLGLVLVEAQCASLKIIMSSNIPNEVIFVPKLITKVSLSNLDLWVKEAANYKNINKNDVYDLYIKSPFSIKNLVKNIELIYSK